MSLCNFTEEYTVRIVIDFEVVNDDDNNYNSAIVISFLCIKATYIEVQCKYIAIYYIIIITKWPSIAIKRMLDDDITNTYLLYSRLRL